MTVAVPADLPTLLGGCVSAHNLFLVASVVAIELAHDLALRGSLHAGTVAPDSRLVNR
jgi:hypothetical protein